MKRSIFILLMLFLGQVFIFAQVSVTGTILDAAGQGIPGVNVVVQGTTTGSVTNLDGVYNVVVPNESAVLVFSYIGFLSQEIEVGNQTDISITLEEDVLGLEEVVVVGYGTQRKIDVTGSVTTMRGEDITLTPTPNFEEGLQGKIPGMQMVKTSAEPGGGTSVKIRGVNSLLGNNEPLYVIDGMPMLNDNQSRPGGWEQQRPLNMLSNLNPNDIESVQVLKDASATAIYGSRGANGVIIITTKKGKSGQAMVDFEYSHTVSKVYHNYEFCNVEQYAEIENAYLWNTRGATPPLYRYVAADSNQFGLDNTPAQLAAIYGEGTNWLDEVLQTGHVDNYNLSIQGGDDRTTYLISANYYDEQGVVIKSDYNRATLRANISSQVNERLKVGVNMSGSRYEADRFAQTQRVTGGGPDRMGIILESFRANPMTTPETPHLEPNDLLQHTPGAAHVVNFIYNPVNEAEERTNTDAMNFFLGSVNAEVNLMEGLNLVFRGGANIQSQERINFLPKTIPVGYWWGALGTHSFFDSRSYVFENYLNFKRTFGGNHSIDLTAGYSAEKSRRQSKSQGGNNFNFDLLGIYGWGQLQTPDPMSSSESQRTLSSMYGRLFYSFSDRYMVTFTARRDGSSVFAANNKYAFFPSGAVAWVVSEESFMSGLNWLSNLKLRGSYGIVGNQAIGSYQSLSTLRPNAYNDPGIVLGGVKQSGLLPNSPANPDLIWESTTQINGGFDASFFANRVRVSADYYKKNTVDLLQNKQVVMVTGFETFTTNYGEVQNWGVEAMVGGSPLVGALKWNTSVTWSFNRNEIVDLGLNSDGTPIEEALPYVLGEPIGIYWGYKWLGNLQESDMDVNGDPTVPVIPGFDEPGDQKFLDFDGDGDVDAEDRHVIGTAEPDFIFGWDNTFSYGNFTLNFFINGVVGGSIFNAVRQYTVAGNVTNNGGRSIKEYAENYWTPERPSNVYPRPGGYAGGGSTYRLEDATFIRLSSATLDYRIPFQQFGMDWVRNASVYVRGSNLFKITDYSGFDPEGAWRGQNAASGNNDTGNYPRPASFEIGVKLGF